MYDLSDNVSESFQFKLDGNDYEMRYPLVEEMEKIQDMVRQAALHRAEAQKNNDVDLLAQADKEEDEIQDFLYGFITPVTDNAPSIAEAMKKQNIQVVRNFNAMFKQEFGLTG